MLDFWTSCIQYPFEFQLYVLNQMAGDLDVANVRRMKLRADIVMLHYPRGIEIGNKGCAGSVGCICGVAHRVV
jgi:hypothetical protein